jgi:carboxypeptidase family protein/TonB-dependent receptor-like protein
MKFSVFSARGFSALSLRNAIGVISLGLAVLVGSSQLFAQGNAGRILGSVTDQSGGAVVGATVNIVDTQRNLTRTVMTDAAGEYNVPNLLPSTYTVSAALQGFKTAQRNGVTLEVNQDLRVDLTLQPGEQSDKITVTGELPIVETTNAELGGTLQSQIIDNLPLNGRNFENLLQLRPGVTIYPGGSGWTQSTNGLRPQDNVYLVNGINATDPWMSQSVFNAVMASGDAGTILPVDAIDEFKTEENPRAEYGWRPGAIVNIGIKSGTNNVHGSGYAYGRDTAFDARNYFNPAYLTPPDKQPVALEQFGGTFGGPIKKDKLFYFVNYEGQRYGIGNPSLHKVPTLAGLIAACQAPTAGGASAPLARLSASLAGLTNTCAIDPSKTTTAGGVQFQGIFPVSTTGSAFTDIPNNNTVNGGLAKINYHLSDKHSLEGMYFISQGDDLAVDAPATQVATPWLSIEHARSQAASGDWTWTPNSTWVNEVRVGYAHYYQLFETQDHNIPAASYTFNGNTYELPTGITNPLYGGFPETRIKGFDAGFRPGGGWPKIIGPDGVLTLLDHVSYLRGRHSYKFGGEVLVNWSTEDETSNAKGPFRFGSLTDFFSGTLSRANLFLGDPIRNLRNQGYAVFLQDDWRVKPRLVVNLGLRYEINTVVKDKRGELANFDPTSATGLVQSNNPYQGDHKDFAPRLGIAWDFQGNAKTVVRAGVGITYEQMGFDVLNGEGNLLGLRTLPTGLPRFNAGSSTSLPTSGNIDLQALTFSNNATLNPINAAWLGFNPALPVAGQTTLYASVANPACGDGNINPNPKIYLNPPGPCEIYGVIPNLRTPYVTQWNLDVERAINNNLSLDVVYVGNHGTRLLGKIDENQAQLVNGFSPGWGDPTAGTGTGSTAVGSPAYVCLNDFVTNGGPFSNCTASAAGEQAALPFTAPCAAAAVGGGATNGSGGPFNPGSKCFSYLSYITLVNNAYVSNYNGMQATLTGRNYRGFSFTAGYTYSHALGDASGQGTGGTFNPPTNSYGSLRQQLYSNTDFDIRHRFTLSMNYVLPGRKGFGQMLEGWGINSIVLIQGGLPWGLADANDDFSGTNEIANSTQGRGEQWNFFGNPSDFTPVHGWTETNGGILSGGHGGVPYFPGGGTATAPTANATCNAKAAALGPLAVASLFNLGCYAVGNSVLVPPAYGSYGTTPQNLWRDAGFKNWDLSVTKQFKFKERYTAEFRAEFFNILNHPIFSNPSGGPGGAVNDPSGGAGFGIVASTPDTYSSNPQLGSGGPRAMQLGLKLGF